MVKRVTTPLTDEVIQDLKAGDEILLSGTLYTARDAAHKRLCRLIERGDPLPVDLTGQIIYFTGPSPPPPGRVIGSAGPTTSCRMDPYSPILIREAGLKGMIGKGNRSREVIEVMKEHGSVYFAAIGGAGALLSNHILESEIICYEELGPEAIRKLTVEDMPLIVAIDSSGNNLYESGPDMYKSVF